MEWNTALEIKIAGCVLFLNPSEIETDVGSAPGLAVKLPFDFVDIWFRATLYFPSHFQDFYDVGLSSAIFWWKTRPTCYDCAWLALSIGQ